MGWRSSAALCLLACLASCRLHVDRVRVGGGWTPEDAVALVPGVDGRGAVLAALGPPDEVRYTLRDEVFLYRRAGHRGIDVRFLIPDPLINALRPGLEQVAPPVDLQDEAGGAALPIRASRTLIEVLLGLLNPLSTEEALALHGRRLRWDVARVVLERETGLTSSVEVYLGIGRDRAVRVMSAAPAETP